MRKIVRFILIVLSAVLLTSCGSTKVKTDETFLENLAKGLSNRWSESDKTNSSAYTDAERREYLAKLVQYEIEAIGDIDSYEFADSDLRTLAMDYVDCLNIQKNAIALYGKDEDEFNEQFTNKGYAGRARDIYDIHNNYTIPLDDKYEDDLNDLYSVGQDVKEEDNKLTALNDLIGEGFTADFNGSQYEIIFENTTDYDFESLKFDMIFYDKDGIEVDSSSEYFENFNSGDKVKSTLYLDDLSLNNGKIIATYSRTYAGNYDEVNTVEGNLTLESNYNFTLELSTATPLEVNFYGYRDKLESTASITSFDYKQGEWYDGETSVELSFSGTKTYENPKGDCREIFVFDYDIYDEDGNEVTGDSVYIDSLSDNEAFQNEKAYINNIKPGNYTIEIKDHSDN